MVSIAVLLTAGLMVLSYQGKLIDPALVALAGGVTGSLGTLLASTRSAPSDPVAGITETTSVETTPTD